MTSSKQHFDAYEQALITVMGCQLPRLTQGWSCQLLFDPSFRLPSCLTLLADTESLLQLVILCDRPHDLFSMYFGREPSQVPPNLPPRPRFEDIVALTASQYATLQTQLASINPWTLENLNLIGREATNICCEWQDGTLRRTHTFRIDDCVDFFSFDKQRSLCRILIELALQSFPKEPFQSYLKELLFRP